MSRRIKLLELQSELMRLHYRAIMLIEAYETQECLGLSQRHYKALREADGRVVHFPQ